MRDDLELCAREYTKHIAELLEANRLRAIVAGEEFAFAPYIGRRYRVNCESQIQQLVCLALATRKLFEESKPSWAPALPISVVEYEKLKYDERPSATSSATTGAR
jgi:hypothetical protein